MCKNHMKLKKKRTNRQSIFIFGCFGRLICQIKGLNIIPKVALEKPRLKEVIVWSEQCEQKEKDNTKQKSIKTKFFNITNKQNGISNKILRMNIFWMNGLEIVELKQADIKS